MLFVLSCKTGNVVKPGAWLTRLPLGAQQYQDLSGNYDAARLALKADTQDSHSQSEQGPGRLKARFEAYSALSLKPEQDYLFNFPNTRT